MPDSAEDVRDLRVALRGAIEELESTIPYVPEYIREKWDFDRTLALLKADALRLGAL